MDTADSLKVPLRYRHRTNMERGIPDQPTSVTFDVTLRRVKHLPLPWTSQVAWVFGIQSGFVSITRVGEVAVKGLTLDSSTEYTELQISQHTPPTGC